MLNSILKLLGFGKKTDCPPENPYLKPKVVEESHDTVHPTVEPAQTVGKSKKLLGGQERLIFLDIETTGLDLSSGHRIVSLAAIESLGGELTNRLMYLIFNPDRKSDPIARRIHGYDSYTLHHQEPLREYAAEIRSWIGDAKVVAHNAKFDISFLNAELSREGLSPIKEESTICTVKLYRDWCLQQGLPKQSAKLDAINSLFEIMPERGVNHDALEDACLCASVYFTLLRSRADEPIVRRISCPDIQTPSNFVHPPKTVKNRADKITVEMAVEAYEKYGTKSAAARALGVSATTITNRLRKSEG
ncbi:MAG: exonuclease domain-containing protein [Pseudomonadota bacterium]